MIIERAMPLGGSVTIDGEDVTDELALKSSITAEDIFITMPKRPIKTGVMYVNGIIYALCEDDSSYYFCKYDGEAWTYLTKPPVKASYCIYVAYNDEIYALYNMGSLYKYDGEAWTVVTGVKNSYGSMFVYNNELHIISNVWSKSGNLYYKWDGESLTQVLTFPKYSSSHSAYSFVYNDTVYCCDITGTNNQYEMYKIVDGSLVRDTSLDQKIINKAGFIQTVEYEGKLYYTKDITLESYYPVGGLGVYDGSDKVSIHGATQKYTGGSYNLCVGMFNVDDKMWIARSDSTIVLACRKMYYNEKEKIL